MVRHYNRYRVSRTRLPDTGTEALGKRHGAVSSIAVQQDEYAAAIPLTPSELNESLEAASLHEIIAAISIFWRRYLPLQRPEA
jgi:hypothetical protein